jgi:glycosyltransferase involved in cell wall biosynthesis
MFAYLYRWKLGDRDGYLYQMGRFYGARGREDAELWWDNHLSMSEMVSRYPFARMVTERARGIFVHTEEARHLLSQDGFDGPVGCAPLPFAATPRHLQKARRPDKPPYRLVVFGYIHLNRRLESVLRALASLPEKNRFVLRIYGELWDAEYVRGIIRTLGLADRVTIHGFVPEAELDRALASSHLALNLRYPSVGEASGSQLRIWNHALPTIVSRVGMYASLPDDTVVFVSPDREVHDIQVHLRNFLSNPSRFAAMGENGRRRLERLHSTDAYASSLVNFVGEVRERRRRGAMEALADRVGRETGAWLNPEHRGKVIRKSAKEIWSFYEGAKDRSQKRV